MSIAILCPTRGRPAFFKRMVDSVSKTTSLPVNVLACSNGDDDYVPRVTTDLPTVHMWNALSKAADARLIMLGADDTIFATPGWDKALMDHYNALENKIHVYALKDSRDPHGTPHPIVTREYVDAMGYFMPPIFLHWFIDTWTVDIAKSNDCFTHLADYELIHDKPSDKGMADETHSRIRRMGWHERDKAVNDSCQHILRFEKERLAKVINDAHFKKFRADRIYEQGLCEV